MTLELDQLLADFEQTSDASLTENTKKLYKSHYDTYCDVISKIDGLGDPEPINETKLKAFLSYRKKNRKSYNTIAADITAISYYCLKNGWKDVTKTTDLSNFKKGLRKLMHAGTNPHAQNPISKQDFIKTLYSLDFSQKKNMFTGALMIIQFYGITRISEVVRLKHKHFTFSECEEFVKIHIEKTKTDQEGFGRDVFIHSDSAYPDLMDLLLSLYDHDNPDEYYFSMEKGKFISESTLRRWFTDATRSATQHTGISTHSLRKGGAHQLAMNQVPVEAIKHQGGWKSPVFLKYTKFTAEETSQQIKGKF